MNFPTRNFGEKRFKNETLIETDDLQLFLQEVEMLVYTDPSEVLGNDFGLDLKSLIWKTNINGAEIENKIRTSIRANSYYVKYFQFEVAVTFVDAQVGRMCIITFTVKRNNQELANELFSFV